MAEITIAPVTKRYHRTKTPNRMFTQGFQGQMQHKKEPYRVAIQHLAGSVCVACNKLLNSNDMFRRGQFSGVELGLCGWCSTFVTQKRIDDDEELSLAEIEYDNSEESAFLREVSGLFDSYGE